MLDDRLLGSRPFQSPSGHLETTTPYVPRIANRSCCRAARSTIRIGNCSQNDSSDSRSRPAGRGCVRGSLPRLLDYALMARLALSDSSRSSRLPDVCPYPSRASHSRLRRIRGEGDHGGVFGSVHEGDGFGDRELNRPGFCGDTILLRGLVHTREIDIHRRRVSGQ